MKTFPIKVEKATPMNFKFVNWKIHNVCNLNCSFCGVQHKDGSNRWFTPDQYKEYTDKIIKAAAGEKIWIQINGGEPTLYPDLINLLAYIKSQGAYTILTSNGTRTIRWWNELKEAKVLDQLFLTYHSEQFPNYRHFSEVVNLFHDEPVSVLSLITHDKTRIDQAFIAYNHLQQNTGVRVLLKAMDIYDYDIYSLYSPEQLEFLKKGSDIGQLAGKVESTVPIDFRLNSSLRVINNIREEKIVESEQLKKDQENCFLGWECALGHKTLRIDYDKVYLGVCEVGGYQKLSDTISFSTTPEICPRRNCPCSFDLLSTKTLPIRNSP